MVAIFIDGGYFEKVMKSRFNSPGIDFTKLSQEIAKTIAPDALILRTYFYDALPFMSDSPTEQDRSRYDNKQRFLYTLNQLPRYQVRYGRCVQRGTPTEGKPRYMQKQVDVLLSVDLVRLSAKGKIDYAVVVAGDTDFVPAIQIAKEEGVMVYLFHEKGFPRNELWSVADERIVISRQLIDKAIIK